MRWMVGSMATKRLRFTASRSSQMYVGVLPVAAARCHFCVRTVPTGTTGPRVEKRKRIVPPPAAAAAVVIVVDAARRENAWSEGF